MTDKAKTAEHYGAISEELAHPKTHRVLIEAFNLDPGIDIAECSFTIGTTAYSNGYTRQVRCRVDGRDRVVGLWRMVPEFDAAAIATLVARAEAAEARCQEIAEDVIGRAASRAINVAEPRPC